MQTSVDPAKPKSRYKYKFYVVYYISKVQMQGGLKGAGNQSYTYIARAAPRACLHSKLKYVASVCLRLKKNKRLQELQQPKAKLRPEDTTLCVAVTLDCGFPQAQPATGTVRHGCNMVRLWSPGERGSQLCL